MGIPQRGSTRKGSLINAAASRCRTLSKSASFHCGAWPLCHPLQMAVRFLLNPLPPPPWPLIARGLPTPVGVGDGWGLPRSSVCPSGWQARRWG
jgi:hypothetical protein